MAKNIKTIKTLEQIDDFLYQLDTVFHDTKNIVLCIDMEFNRNREIGIIQLMVVRDYNKMKDHVIYLYDPKMFTDDQFKKMIKLVFCSKTIKIMHGSDSMDMPYISSILSKSEFKHFVLTMIDTLFMCDMLRIIKKKLDLPVPPKACSLYNSLLFTETIDSSMYSVLNNLGKKINYNMKWDITRLSKTQLYYSAMDVLYLFDMVEQMYVLASWDHLLETITKIYQQYLFKQYDIKDVLLEYKKEYEIEYDSHRLTIDMDDIKQINLFRKILAD